MRHQTLSRPTQHSFSFLRLDIWQSIPAKDRRQCLDLYDQMLRVVARAEQTGDSEVNDERQDPPHAS